MNIAGSKSVKWSVVIAGLAGGTVAAVLFDGHWRQKVAVLFIGALTSLYVTPWICERLHATSPDTLSFAGFLTGVVGYSLVRLSVRFVEQRGDSLLSQYVARLLGVESKS